jgi:hypothetical protein
VTELLRFGQRRYDMHPMGAGKVLDVVENGDPIAAVGRVGKPLGKIQDFHLDRRIRPASASRGAWPMDVTFID